MARQSGGGVTWRKVGPDKFKLVWRQWEEADGQRVRKQRYKVVVGVHARDKLAVQIREAIATQGYWEVGARPEVRICNLELGFAGWMEHKKARGVSDGTLKVLGSVFTRIGRTFRTLLPLGKDDVLPGDVLTRELVAKALLLWQAEGLTEARRYDLVRILYEAWRWLADEPTRWPGIEKPPLDRSHVLPLAPVRRSPPPSPTWAEMDAVIRRAGTTRTEDLAAILAVQRCTGLRIGQVCGIRCRDVDVARRTLTVVVGKSRKEKADRRTIPITTDVANLLGTRSAVRKPDDPVFASRLGRPRVINPQAVRRLLEAASVAKEIRSETWDFEDRKNRATHWFRAGFQSELSRDGVQDSIVKALVGHSDGSTMRQHYAAVDDTLVEQMREAVDRVPPIAWAVEAANVTRIDAAR
ncbi:MAG: tyrosine-type recombinase/integrase [Myxococcota bacterium]